MAAIDRFVSILSPLKIYTAEENSRVYRELSVCSEEFDLLEEELDGLLREMFIVTAQDSGLSGIESIYTAPNGNVGLDRRRQKILNRLAYNDNCFTLEEIKSAVRDFGAEDFKILEFPSRYNAVVEIYGDYDSAAIDFIKSEIKKIMPAHLNIEVYFNGLTWNEIESGELAFDDMDGKNYTWEYIDEIKI